MIRFGRNRTTILLVAAIAAVLLLGRGGSASNAAMPLAATLARQDTPASRRAAQPEHAVARMAAHSASGSEPTFAQLSTAADAGDARAACTLGMLLEMCASRTSSEDLGRALLDGAASATEGSETERRIAARVQAIEQTHQRYQSFCAALGAKESAQSHARMLQAVRLDSPHAALRYFLQPQLRTRSGAIVLSRAADYDEHAVAGLERAAERGNALAMYSLFTLLATGEFNSTDVALTAEIQPGKAIALGRAVLPALDPPSAARVRTQLQQLESQASGDALRESRQWSSRFVLDPDRSSLDGLPDVAEDVSHCGTE